ncbi:pilus assembly PilX N-terminal domain-containing protein [Thalassotalea nanhaiensis]|uniref:Pilus assembly PilX N-terminal domain-containing protein n=1 Tax=Thalassotalea nanhaiensis TaxID=3065648 RepID=A0ABY9TIT2_9GAMM|nr:pilus assembly PilX N-terminal domain-containing protein [Colwelliaceae bacterium SQ345]
MYPRNPLLLTKQKGASLIMAVFMLVIFSLFAAVLVRMVGSSTENISYEVIGLRAYAAADSGLQWGLQQIFPLSSGVIECANVDFNNVPILQVAGLEQCQIESLQCSDFVEGDTRYYTITSTGTCTSGDITTSRTLQIDARNL